MPPGCRMATRKGHRSVLLSPHSAAYSRPSTPSHVPMDSLMLFP